MITLKLKPDDRFESRFLCACCHLLVLMFVLCGSSSVYAAPFLKAGIAVCQQNSNIFDRTSEEDNGFGLLIETSLSEFSFIDIEGCMLSTRIPEYDIDLQNFEKSRVISNGGEWASIGLGRRFFKMFFLRSGLYYLEDKTQYYLYNLDDNGRRTNSQDITIMRPLLGIGGSFGLTYPADSKFSIFASIGIVQYFYNFERSKMEYQFYRTSNIGLSISR